MPGRIGCVLLSVSDKIYTRLQKSTGILGKKKKKKEKLYWSNGPVQNRVGWADFFFFFNIHFPVFHLM